MTDLKVNDPAPDFLLPCDNGDSIALEDFADKNVVVYFYPKDDTPGCTQEAKDFKERHAEFARLDTIILGVSRDTVDKHDEFKSKYGLPFNLLSDEDSEMVDEYGVWVEKSMYGRKYMGVERATFLINKEKKLVKIWRKVSVTGHAQEVLAEVKKMMGVA